LYHPLNFHRWLKVNLHSLPFGHSFKKYQIRALDKFLVNIYFYVQVIVFEIPPGSFGSDGAHEAVIPGILGC
jgi:hypothetical protein